MSHRRTLADRLLRIAAILGIAAFEAARAQVGPTVTPGFPNVPQTPGSILSGINAPGQGRTAVIAYHNGVLFTVPEIPSSQPGADFQVRTWDISDPTAPVELAQWGTTPHPIAAHGYFKSGDYLIIGPNWPPETPWSFAPGAQPHTVQRTSFPELTCSGARGCLFGPWYVDQTFWSYSEVSGDAEIYFDWNLLSSWDHLGLTGVIGHPFLIGDLLIFASDQSRTGVATYDVGDPTNPVLLDVLTTGGPGGYWPEIWGHDGSLYVVFPYRTGGNGFRVVDVTDPSNLRFVTDRSLPGDASMYIQFQDEYAFMGSHKVDMRTFESVLFLDGANTPRPNQPGQVGIDTSQHLLPLGNLLVTGGVGPNEGMAIWAHQAEPDTRGPSVGYHIPQAGRTNYPTGAPISLLIHETLETTTIVDGDTVIVRPVGGNPISGRITFSFDDVLTYQPDDELLPDTSYEVVIPEGGIKDAAGNGIQGYSFTFSTGSTIGGNTAPEIDSFTVSQHPVAPNQSVTLSASASDDDDDAIEYRFDFGDGSAKTAWSSSSSVATSYAEPGHYRAGVQARDPAGSVASQTRSITVVLPASGSRPANSSPIHCDEAARRVWVANPDNDSIAALDADTGAVMLEVPVCDDPRSIAVSSTTAEVWVACHDDDSVRVLDDGGNPLASIDTGHGSAPSGLALSPDGASAFVSLYGAGSLLRLDTQTRQQNGSIDLGPTPHAVAIRADGTSVLVTRFLSPRNHAEVWEVDAATMNRTRTIVIPKFGGDENFDSTAAGRGVANYLAGITIAPDGTSAWVAANKPNSERGLLFGPDLDQDNTVRNIIVQIDLNAGSFARAIDIDNSDSSRAIAFSPLGDYLAVALQGNDETVVFDALSIDGANGLGSFVTRLGAGSAPQGLCIDAPTGRIFVKNLMSRDVTVQEAAPLFDSGNVSISSSAVSTVSSESLPAQVRLGKQIFYNASDPRMSAEGYLSCATCHVDGGHDGRVWDFTGRGEGLRNTTTLRGRAGTGHGNVHWSANFDEIQDFENDIRNAFGGSGFLSDADFALTSDTLATAKAGRSAELDALAAYVTSLDDATAPRSPWRNSDGTMTASALAGQTHFVTLGCADCHSGTAMTDSTLGAETLHDVGTMRTTSGQRLAGPLLGIDTPSLLGVWAGAPYFHDGSAPTLEDVFEVAGGVVLPAESASVSPPANIINQWVELNNDDTVHGRALVGFNGAGSAFTFFNVDGGSGGIGAIEARYSSGYGVYPVDFTVNGTVYSGVATLPGNAPQWRLTNWGTVRVDDVVFTPGATNTIRVSSSTDWAYIGFDEIVVSNPDDLAAAQPHRVALSLPQTQRGELADYLRQIEGAATAATHSIAGQIYHAGSLAPLSGTLVSLSGGEPASAVIGPNGDFAFDELAQSTWSVGARRDDDSLAGISALDAAWALQSAVGTRVLTPIQQLACDVSANGSVSPLDASYILQRMLGSMAEFPVAAACNSDWVFLAEPSSAGAVPPAIAGGDCELGGFTYDPLDAPANDAHFSGTAFGDCTLNGGAAAATTAALATAPTVVVGRERRNRGRYFRVTLGVSGIDELSAIDLDLRYDPARLKLRRLRKAPRSRTALVRSADTAAGQTRVIFAAAQLLAPTARPLLYAVFETIGDGAAEISVTRALIDDTAAGVASAPTRRRRRSRRLILQEIGSSTTTGICRSPALF